MARAKTAGRDVQFNKAELQERHEKQLARKAALAAQRKEKRDAAIEAATQARDKFKTNPTKKNHRNFVTALRRAA